VKSTTPGKPEAIPASVNGWQGEYLDSEYQRYRQDPGAVSEGMRSFFQGFDLALAGRGPVPVAAAESPFQNAVDALIEAYRELGHLSARLDPFGRERARPAALTLGFHGLTEADLDKHVEGGPAGQPSSATLGQVVSHLEETYCGSIGLEFMHIQSSDERAWFLAKFEANRGAIPLSAPERLTLLSQLRVSQTFESFVGIRYGAAYKWFSLEGSITLIPTLEQMIEHSSELGVEEIVIGMPHRGRVNVLNSVMGKTFEQIFTEFEDNWEAGYIEGGGDVKYHRGYSQTRALPNGKTMRLAMASNPSHLESVNPVVLGRVRAKQRIRNDTQRRRVIPLLLHGDAAVAGQGMVAECLNMSQLEGYTVGGTVHVVVNNLIGFTTLPEDGRSTTYCTDVAKMVDAPIFHVNGEDPEACAAAARLAIQYRQQFRKDVFIDMWCYRKYGHNEGDEQSFTQPTLVALIKNKQTTLEGYTRRLVSEGLISEDEAKAKVDELMAVLDRAQVKAKREPHPPTIDPGNARWSGNSGGYTHDPVETGVARGLLTEICAALARVPEGFTVNPKLKAMLQQRADLPKTGHVSYADAELLAVGSLLMEAVPIRLSGQDSRRGTFSHRHAVLRDFTTGDPYVSLNNLREMGVPGTDKEPGTPGGDGRPRQARFCVYDSPLSEVSVLGYDYGYSLADPKMLVLWEAQFGDFTNGAQVIIDQYIASSEIKWSRWSGLTLLLPHGYEAAGPEHSSCRLERFLLLCANDNIQVVNPTTGAQIFHVLRRQLKRGFRKPLVIATPKRMLRTPTSTFDELTKGSFRELIDDPAFESGGADRKGVTRVILCSGKVYFELAERCKATERTDIALVRIEQLYPFHAKLAMTILAKYPKTAERVYVQEEPRNAGCYLSVADTFRTQLGIELRYIGRETSATPAVGSKKADLIQQEAVISAAIGPPPGGKSVEGGTPAKASREAKSPEPAHSAPARG